MASSLSDFRYQYPPFSPARCLAVAAVMRDMLGT